MREALRIPVLAPLFVAMTLAACGGGDGEKDGAGVRSAKQEEACKGYGAKDSPAYRKCVRDNEPMGAEREGPCVDPANYNEVPCSRIGSIERDEIE